MTGVFGGGLFRDVMLEVNSSSDFIKRTLTVTLLRPPRWTHTAQSATLLHPETADGVSWMLPLWPLNN